MTHDANQTPMRPDAPPPKQTALLTLAVRYSLRYRLWLLAACLLVAGLAIAPAQRLTLDRSIIGLFKSGDPRLANYVEGETAFGGSETAIIAFEDPRLTTAEGLQRLEEFESQLAAVPGVLQVLSLAKAKLPGGLLSTKSLRELVASGDIQPATLRRELLACDLYRGRLLSADGKTTVMLATLAAVESTSTPRNVTIQQIRSLCDSREPRAVVSGGPILVDGIYEHMERDGRTLGLASSLVLALVIGVLFRNLRWILLPLLVVHITLVWTKAFLVLSDIQLSMVSSPLVAMVTVIGTATVVHIAIRFREERASNLPEAALRRTLIHIGPAIFWTCLTTALGFGSLLISQVAPVGSFGGMMAVGSMLVFAATFGVIPAGVLLGDFLTDPARAPGEGIMARALDRVVAAVEQHPWRVAIAVSLLIGIMALGMLRLEVATEFDQNFRRSSPEVKSYRFIVDRMKTTKTIDVLIDTPAMEPSEVGPFLERVRSLQTELSQQPGVVGALSIVDILDFMTQSPTEPTNLVGGGVAFSLRLLSPKQRLDALRFAQPSVVKGFWNEDRQLMRIILQVGDVRGSNNKVALVESIERSSRKRFPGSRAGGISVLLIYLVKSLLADQWITFSLAVAAILLTLTVALRDWRLGLIALLPNAAPIIVVVGAMGWLGIRINVATAMLASVSMGLSADFSIHYLFRFRQEMRDGRNFMEALHSAHQSVGLAMVLANIALIAGFSTLIISAFIPTVHFGLLVSVAMIGGLIGNLTVLPLLLHVLHIGGAFATDKSRDG